METFVLSGAGREVLAVARFDRCHIPGTEAPHPESKKGKRNAGDRQDKREREQGPSAYQNVREYFQIFVRGKQFLFLSMKNVGIARSSGLQGPNHALLVQLDEWTLTAGRQSHFIFSSRGGGPPYEVHGRLRAFPRLNAPQSIRPLILGHKRVSVGATGGFRRFWVVLLPRSSAPPRTFTQGAPFPKALFV